MKKYFSKLAPIFKFNPCQRVWQLPFFAALGVGLILSVAMFFQRMDYGLIAILGVAAFLYVPNTPMHHRMAVVMCVSFGISLSFFLGLLAHLSPVLTPFVVAFVAACSSILVRYYDLGAPGYFFFVFACILGTFLPFEVKDFITLIGLICLGTMVANVMAFLYSLSVIYVFKNSLPSEVPPRGHLGFNTTVVDSLIMGAFVGFAMFLGSFLSLERSYWVGVSCTAVMQGISVSAIWIKQFQRIIGTFIGAIFAWFLLKIHFSPIAFILLMMFLMFMTEYVVFKNYALAMVFITPYVTYLVESATSMSYDADLITKARFIDVALGSILGLLGGYVMYNQKLRIYFLHFAHKIFKFKNNKFT
ncbi:FUSC family protein [Campylobacter sp. US33a]|uniref:FUSC family protein n=1 Tax=Campylobacter sp. CCS1377 TaxID=3158229 RepID=A0AAU7E6Q0_9BACT|nr:FUSC family protein [Campylobacter sp. US33a]MCW1360824.1 FUSC family protein [Campylobacter jejuni]TEY01155.1 FUSC family protein [Campylobacter sp. US33a]